MSKWLKSIKKLFGFKATAEGAFGEAKAYRARAGDKVIRQAFEGRLGLRGRVLGGAAQLAQQGKWGKR